MYRLKVWSNFISFRFSEDISMLKNEKNRRCFTAFVSNSNRMNKLNKETTNNKNERSLSGFVFTCIAAYLFQVLRISQILLNWIMFWCVIFLCFVTNDSLNVCIGKHLRNTHVSISQNKDMENRVDRPSSRGWRDDGFVT